MFFRRMTVHGVDKEESLDVPRYEADISTLHLPADTYLLGRKFLVIFWHHSSNWRARKIDWINSFHGFR